MRFLPYLENGDPGVANVVKVDGPLVRVVLPGSTHVVVLVPVNAAVAAGPAHGGGAVHAALRVRRHVVAAEHPVLARCRADERTVLTLLGHVVRIDGQVVYSVKEKSAGKNNSMNLLVFFFFILACIAFLFALNSSLR